MFKAGAVPGAEVHIGTGDNSVVFDWEPTVMAGAELLAGPRGTDLRVEETLRPSRSEKRADHTKRMDAKTDAREQLWTERQAGIWTDDDDSSGPLESGVPQE